MPSFSVVTVDAAIVEAKLKQQVSNGQ
jgi:hypothetical protein